VRVNSIEREIAISLPQKKMEVGKHLDSDQEAELPGIL
jgi:hypothetical protein